MEKHVRNLEALLWSERNRSGKATYDFNHTSMPYSAKVETNGHSKEIGDYQGLGAGGGGEKGRARDLRGASGKNTEGFGGRVAHIL